MKNSVTGKVSPGTGPGELQPRTAEVNSLRCGGIGRLTGLGNFLFVVNREEQKAAKGVMAVIAPASE